jgi:sugar/nucleoside kinase (ribokinase family)
VGLNATDTVLLVRNFPAYGGKVPFVDEILSPGGQVASAMVACAKLGLKAKYIGSIGDDLRGRIQAESLSSTGINLDDVIHRENCANQSAYIIVDQSTGERTVFWSRPECLKIDTEWITPDKIACARMLHIDGHDTPAVTKAARLARENGVPVSVDVDTIYPGFEDVLSSVDYLIASSEFPGRWTKENDPFKALEIIYREYNRREFGMKVAAMTLGANGALALESGRFVYSPGFQVNCIDTTGAGDVFHGAFCYSVLRGMSIEEALEFSNAMAALNCTKLGARGGIGTIEAVKALLAHPAGRTSSNDFRAAKQTA